MGKYNPDEYSPNNGLFIGSDGEGYWIDQLAQMAAGVTMDAKTITENGTYRAVDDDIDGYTKVTVAVPASETAEKSITENGVYIASDDNVAGYSKVTVNVPDAVDVIKDITMKYVRVVAKSNKALEIIPLGANIETQTLADGSTLNQQGSNIVQAFIGACPAVTIKDPEGLARTIKANAFAETGTTGFMKRLLVDWLYAGQRMGAILESDTVTAIEGAAFRYNYYVMQIDMRSVTSIGTNAFQYAIQLEIAYFGGVTIIPEGAFYGCSALWLLNFFDTSGEYEGITSIGSNAFNGCSALETFPNLTKVTSIGSTAFKGCVGLTEANLDSLQGLTGSSQFEGCTGLETVVFGDTDVARAYTAANVFKGCTSLESVTFEGDVSNISSTFFSNTPEGITITFKGVLNTQARVEAMTNYPFGATNANFVYDN